MVHGPLGKGICKGVHKSFFVIQVVHRGVQEWSEWFHKSALRGSVAVVYGLYSIISKGHTKVGTGFGELSKASCKDLFRILGYKA